MASCTHLTSTSLHPPRTSDSVYREDCTLCFDSIDSPAGLSVCLHCFNGGCSDERDHARLHATQAHHPLAINIKRTRKRKDRGEPPPKLSKLAISAETDEDRYETSTDLRCLECGIEGLQREGKVEEVVQGVLKANTFSKQEEVKAWELELTPCEHTLCLEQDASRQIASGDLGHCGECDLRENLWLCLTCGNLGCGRKQVGGGPGNNHQVEHNQSTGHPVAVKLGSISAEGNADIYCYACNEERIDSELVHHLSHWGIDIAGRVKTEKSMQELAVEQNISWDFSMTTNDGKELKAVFGPGFTGLKNLGNSCYLNSILQSLFSMPEFANRYHRPDEDVVAATGKPAEDLEIQLRKIADGLLSGRYSVPDTDVVHSEDTSAQPHQRGLAPAMLKYLIGRGHAEFSTMRQQDSFELLLHLLKLVTRSQQSAKSQYKDTTDPVDAFRFIMEQKLQCLSCRKVRYSQDLMENLSVAVPIRRTPKSDAADIVMSDDSSKPKDEFEPVTLEECLASYTAPETVDLVCSSCNSKGFTKQTLFQTFPTILAVNARRFEIVNWVPTKQDVPVIVRGNTLDLESYRAPPHSPDEDVLPEDAASSSAANSFTPNAIALESLMGMGFPKPRCERALHATGNSDAETAMSWLFEHMEDTDIDAPLEFDGGSAGGAMDAEKIENLGAMGFSAPQARQALRETGGDVERAVDWLFSHPEAVGEFAEDAETTAPATAAAAPEADSAPAKYGLKSIVCHKGSSIHAGHYVAFVRKRLPDGEGKEEWVLFNDEKVAAGGDGDELQKFAYVYFLRRESV